MDSHEWDDPRPCWPDGSKRFRVGDNPAGAAMAVKEGAVWTECAENFPLRAFILAREILRLAEDEKIGADLLRVCNGLRQQAEAERDRLKGANRHLADNVAELEGALAREKESRAAAVGGALEGFRKAQATIAEREDEIRFLRRERKLLIDLEKTRSNILGSLFASGMAQTDDVNFVHETNGEMVKLHLEASGGILRPEGSPCRCVLCEPRRDLGKKDWSLVKGRTPVLEDVPPGAAILPREGGE